MASMFSIGLIKMLGCGLTRKPQPLPLALVLRSRVAPQRCPLS